MCAFVRREAVDALVVRIDASAGEGRSEMEMRQSMKSRARHIPSNRDAL
jgi:hypothetical protein